MKDTILLSLLFFYSAFVYGQSLQPGFDKNEYIDLMKLSAQFGDSAYRATLSVPPRYTLAYRSDVMGLENRWDLWTRNGETRSGGTSSDQIAVISVRGTTEKSESWLGNFYAAMVPAQGELTLSDDFTFPYQLATHPRAAVHVGWLISTAFLVRDMLPRIDSCYQTGIKDMIILGHSQGGAIAYLLTAHLYSLQQQGEIPSDIRFKTYCSAAPKPGNLYFAYEYEAMTQDGWAYNVVNSADWVPEVPVTVQTLDDFNRPNPFANARGMIKKQKLKARIALTYAYNKLYKPTRKAQRNYQKILGEYTSKQVKALLPGFQPPRYFDSNDYVRTGNTITLLADKEYYAWNQQDSTFVFAHHFHQPYIYLAEKLNFSASSQTMNPENKELSGNWELEYLSGPRIAFQGLFPDKKPQIAFDPATQKVEGNSGCNGYSTSYTLKGNAISFGEPGPTTMMYCGEGEKFFLNTIKKVNRYMIDSEGKLNLMIDDVPMMRFIKLP